MASKYQAILTHLTDRPEPTVELTFDELDELIGGLPTSARTYPSWWVNSRRSQVHARYWLEAGRLATPDFTDQRVRFDLGEEKTVSPPPPKATPPPAARPIEEVGDDRAVVAHVAFEWEAIGPVTVGSSGKPRFPVAATRAGLFRIDLSGDGGEPTATSIGESDNVARRLNAFRNPGLSQMTNQRIHDQVRATIDRGGSAVVSVVNDVEVDGEPADLSSRPVRRLAASAAVLRATEAGRTVEPL